MAAVAKDVPSEMDYIIENWTYTEIVEQYAITVYKASARVTSE